MENIQVKQNSVKNISKPVVQFTSRKVTVKFEFYKKVSIKFEIYKV